jgi:hypothetical protein
MRGTSDRWDVARLKGGLLNRFETRPRVPAPGKQRLHPWLYDVAGQRPAESGDHSDGDNAVRIPSMTQSSAVGDLKMGCQPKVGFKN